MSVNVQNRDICIASETSVSSSAGCHRVPLVCGLGGGHTPSMHRCSAHRDLQHRHVPRGHVRPRALPTAFAGPGFAKHAALNFAKHAPLNCHLFGANIPKRFGMFGAHPWHVRGSFGRMCAPCGPGGRKMVEANLGPFCMCPALGTGGWPQRLLCPHSQRHPWHPTAKVPQSAPNALNPPLTSQNGAPFWQSSPRTAAPLGACFGTFRPERMRHLL